MTQSQKSSERKCDSIVMIFLATYRDEMRVGRRVAQPEKRRLVKP